MLARRAVRILRRLGIRRVSQRIRSLSGAYKVYTLIKLALVVGATCLAVSLSEVEITISNPQLGKAVRMVFHLAGPMGIIGAVGTVAIGYFVLKLRLRDIIIAISLGLLVGLVVVRVVLAM